LAQKQVDFEPDDRFKLDDEFYRDVLTTQYQNEEDQELHEEKERQFNVLRQIFENNQATTEQKDVDRR
jgi:hypothetical protein